MLHLQETYNVSFFPLKYFSWVKSNKLACMWLWMKFHTEILPETVRKAGNVKGIEIPLRPFIKYRYSDELDLNQTPVNHEERFNLIINFIYKHSEKYRTEIREREIYEYTPLSNQMYPTLYLI